MDNENLISRQAKDSNNTPIDDANKKVIEMENLFSKQAKDSAYARLSNVDFFLGMITITTFISYNSLHILL